MELLDVILNGEVYELGDGLFPSKEEALDWIEKNKRPTVLESFDFSNLRSLPGRISDLLSAQTGTVKKLPRKYAIVEAKGGLICARDTTWNYLQN